MRSLILIPLAFLRLLVSNTMGGSIIRLIMAFCMPPLSVFFTLLSIRNNPLLSSNFWINLFLTVSPAFGIGCVHAIWVVCKGFWQESNTQQSSQINTRSNSSSNNNWLHRIDTIVSILTRIITTYIAVQTFYHLSGK